MKKIVFLILILFAVNAYGNPDNSMSITPVAVAGAKITASDENTRNSVVSSAYNAHDHTDISKTANTLNIGDGAAGDKKLNANNADTFKPYIKFEDTTDNWIVSSNGVAPSLVLSGSSLVFEGSSDDAYETTFSITDPTVDRTQTFQDDSGVIPLGTMGNTLKFTTTGATNVTLPISGTIITSAGAGGDIDIGTFSLTANTLISDVATGTAPLTVASTTTVTNLSADTVDGINSTSTDLKPFGAWVDKSASYVAQQATTDGFVVARIGGSTEAFASGFTDGNADPSTCRNSVRGFGTIESVSFTMPVKKSDYWKVIVTSGSVDSIFWIPLGN
jgi:hypothetical protein